MDSKSTNQEEVFEQFINDYQQAFVAMLEKHEKKVKVLQDSWKRADGNGYGLSCVAQDGDFFEKAGVNTTRLTVPLSPALAGQMKDRPEKAHLAQKLDFNNLGKYTLYANGVSLVIHPVNPFVPTSHANYRFLRIKNAETGEVIDEWFGGGSDLTPIYLFEEDAVHYHTLLKNACVQADAVNGEQLYRKYKKECDEYFYIKHRKEGRGVGGLFFDDFTLNNSFDAGLNFLKLVAYSNLQAYDDIITKRDGTPYNDVNLRWKQYRRGRYVEFNLVYDRGTKFGLNTPDARIESILMSLPLLARWEYNFEVQPNTEEAKIVEVLQHPKDWA